MSGWPTASARTARATRCSSSVPDGKLLLTLGKAGVAGAGPDEFNAPSAVLVAPNGDIFVGDGHGGNTNARIVKFSQRRQVHQDLGQEGLRRRASSISRTRWRWIRKAACSSATATTTASRSSTRTANSSPSGSSSAGRAASSSTGTTSSTSPIPKSESVRNSNPGWKRGIRVGSARTGEVTALIPDPVEKITGTSAAEGVAADAAGQHLRRRSRPEAADEICEEVSRQKIDRVALPAPAPSLSSERSGSGSGAPESRKRLTIG